MPVPPRQRQSGRELEVTKCVHGVISPLLRNIYLHEVLDTWFVRDVQPACGGRTFMVRFADDFVMGFEREEDAHKVPRVIAKRFARFGLQINAEKTRLGRFQRPPRDGDDPDGEAGTFDFLGFTVYWGRSRRGSNRVLLKTARSRFTRALRALKEWGWANRHLPLQEQPRGLNEKLRGHDAYSGVTGNHRMLHQLRWAVQKVWQRWLARRNRGEGHNWAEFQALLRRYPWTPARVVHSRL